MMTTQAEEQLARDIASGRLKTYSPEKQRVVDVEDIERVRAFATPHMERNLDVKTVYIALTRWLASPEGGTET